MVDAAVTLSDLLREGRAMLAKAGVEDPGLESRMLVEHFTGTTRLQAVTGAGQPIAADRASLARLALGRRVSGEPVHRIIGSRAFYGLDLRLSPATLEPRPDTETLVDAMLPFVKNQAERHGCCRILDLGTGTGAIALALLAHEPRASATGVDVSAEALETALGNARSHGLDDRFSALQSDWFKNVSGHWDAIVSNPPYIRSGEIAALNIEVRGHDPHSALDGGSDGLAAYRAIASKARDHLSDDGDIGVEFGFDQKKDVLGIFQEHGLRMVSEHRDMGGNDRVLVFERQERRSGS